MLVCYIYIIILIIVLFYFLKKKEDFESYSIDAMDNDLKKEIELILKRVIDNINKNFNKKLLIGNIDRVEKTMLDNKINYLINVFIYNNYGINSINRKMIFDIDITENEIIINKIYKGLSSKLDDNQYGGVSTRGATLFKPAVNIDNVSGSIQPSLDFKEIHYSETKNKLVDRNSWILPPELTRHNIYIPTRKILHIWDKNGIEVTSNNLKNTPILNHGMKPLNNIPDFVKYNFENKEEDSNNSWLFDLASDSASRPIGVSSSKGTK